MAQSRPPATPISIGSRADASQWHMAQSRAHSPRYSLPTPLTRFIGRERAMVEIARLLTTARLLTLTGPGGCGKTRLALAVATHAVATAPHGVCLIEFASVSDGTLVAQTVATALGVREESHRALLDTCIDVLREGSPLLLFDNCEHLIAPIATLVKSLLVACPDLRVLTTSRELLDVPGEMTWRVPPLSLPAQDDTPSAARLMESEAAQLFVDRVRLRQPAFVVTDAHAPAIIAICRRLDGLPLALELAAARANLLSLPEMEVRLDDALQLLRHGGRTTAPRHQTLRATLDWSYDLLETDERTVLQRLAIFADGCGLSAAEVVCAGKEIAEEDVLSLLGQLVEKSLVQRDERGGETRYRLLETIRQYAHERLVTSGETEHVGQRHADWFLALAVQASPGLNGPTMATWLERLEIEHENLRAALRWLLEHKQATGALQIGASIYLFWYARGYLSEGRTWLHDALSLAQSVELSPTDMTTYAFVTYCAGRLAMLQGDYDTADTLLQDFLAAARVSQHQRYIGYALTQLGHLALFQRDFATAHARYTEGLTLRQSLGDREGIAIMTGSLGRVALHEGDFPRARALLEACLATFRALDANTETISVLCDLGHVAMEEGDLALARARFAEGLTLCRERSVRQGVPQCLEGFALLLMAQGQPERALRIAGTSAAIRTSMNIPLSPVAQERLAQGMGPARHTLDALIRSEMIAAGQAMPLEDAIADVLAVELSPSVTVADRRKARYGGLTAREYEIAAQVAGRTNREIAQALFVSEKTVEWHVSNSLRKLGFRTRAELAVWAIAVALPLRSPAHLSPDSPP